MMMLNSVSLRLPQFIQYTAAFVRSLQTSDPQTLRNQDYSLFVGNDAADADSIISALTYSYLSYRMYDCTADNEIPMAFIPCVGVSKDELKLRRDVQLLLNRVGVNLLDLVCMDEMSQVMNAAETSKTLNNFRINLLDHNKLSTRLSNMIPGSSCSITIDEIIDHHFDEGFHMNECFGSKRNIAFDVEKMVPLAGSACTLVFEKYYATDLSRTFLDRDIALLLMGVISLDTINMDPSAAKGTARDLFALDILSKLCAPTQQKEVFEELANCKFDINFWTELSAFDCLRLDFKPFEFENQSMKVKTSIGISSILLSSATFYEKADLFDAIGSYFSNEKEYDVLITMHSSKIPVYTKQIVVNSQNLALIHSLKNFLLRSQEGSPSDGKLHDMQLKCTQEDEIQMNGKLIYRLHFEQLNTKNTRKQLVPLLQKFVENC